MKLMKVVETTKFDYDTRTKLITTVRCYHYKDEAEKKRHAVVMAKKGYEDSGQVQENIGSFASPIWVFIGQFHKSVKKSLDS